MNFFYEDTICENKTNKILKISVTSMLERKQNWLHLYEHILIYYLLRMMRNKDENVKSVVQSTYVMANSATIFWRFAMCRFTVYHLHGWVCYIKVLLSVLWISYYQRMLNELTLISKKDKANLNNTTLFKFRVCCLQLVYWAISRKSKVGSIGFFISVWALEYELRTLRGPPLPSNDYASRVLNYWSGNRINNDTAPQE